MVYAFLMLWRARWSSPDMACTNQTHLLPSHRSRSAVAPTFGRTLFIGLLVAGGLCVSPPVFAAASQQITPLILSVYDAPVPFTGSDGRTHVVYELWLTNFSSAVAKIGQVEIFGDGALLQTLDQREISTRLQPAGRRTASGKMKPGTQSLLFINVILADGQSAPTTLSHQVTATIGAHEVVETGGEENVDSATVTIIGPPLQGSGYISADSCCDASRHTRAALPVNGRVWIAQRYAVDWEQLDNRNRIYVGPRRDVHSYKIYGAQVFAVANATVVTAVDGLPNQTPGKFPENLPIDEADGNHVVLQLPDGSYALYAHLEPNSVAVTEGQTVTQGQLIGLVGNSGNSIAPHLHFQLTNLPLSLASNGLPYEIDAYHITAISPGTEAFDRAEADGTPLDVTPVTPPQAVENALPLDQLIISFP
jgi:murein DD-endopeptidase MepM/ murein hydrolase activator NlpD